MSLEQSETGQSEQSTQDEQATKKAEAKAAKEEAKANKATASQKTKQLLSWVAMILRGETAPVIPPSEKLFGKLEESGTGVPGTGEYTAVEHLSNRTIKKVSEDYFKDYVAAYLKQHLAIDHKPFREHSEAHVNQVFMDFWRFAPITQLVDVEQFATLDESGLAFTRLPYSLGDTYTLDDCPTFKDVLSSVEYGIEGLLAFIGSIFDNRSNKSQYLYLFGEGGSGKSTLTGFLHRVMNSAACIAEPPKRDDRFFMSSVYTKRLIIFNDVENYKVVEGTEIKQLTGDSTVFVDIKNGPAFNARVNAKLMLCSNHEPGISSKTSDTRRIVPVRMRAPVGGAKYSTEDMSRLLDSEGRKFLNVCWAEYQKAVKDNRGYIPVDKDEIATIAGGNESDFESAFDSFLFFDQDIGITTDELRYVADNLKWNKSTRFGFTNWLKEKGNVKYQHTWLKGSHTERTRKAYYGVGIRAEHRRPASSPAPDRPSWSVRTAPEWKSFVEGLGHKLNSEETRELMKNSAAEHGGHVDHSANGSGVGRPRPDSRSF